VTAREICPPTHKHAVSSNCYNRHRCGCAPCLEAITSAALVRRKQQAFGRYVDPFVPADKVRARLLELRTAGVGLPQVARNTGVSLSVIRGVMVPRSVGRNRPVKTQPAQRILATNAERILAFEPRMELLSSGTNVPAFPTVRRLQALVTNGWSITRLAGRLGVTQQNFSFFLAADKVTVRTHLRIEALYEELWNVQPVSSTPNDRISVTVAKKHAAARRWLPPMAWDDIDTDIEPPLADVDPDYTDDVLIGIAMTGEAVRLTRAERLIALTRLHARHLTDGVIAELLHVDARTVLRDRQELGLPAAVGPDKQPLLAA